ncbi:neuraminidase-like domain-containing protein [Leptodesmis sp.]|uniref:neuraminidase-like domain-containing protein n=1 Tax=Leptodesmis sp. TaxID=3100501 RepID=UPI0040534890
MNGVGDPDIDLASKAKYLSEQLLIDCQTSSCQKTTRISQAITTLQTLIFSLRTGQLEDLPSSLIDDE